MRRQGKGKLPIIEKKVSTTCLNTTKSLFSIGLYATVFFEGVDALSGNLFGVPHYQAVFLE